MLAIEKPSAKEETEPSDYIEIPAWEVWERRAGFVGGFEPFSIVLMILSIVVTILAAYINQTKK